MAETIETLTNRIDLLKKRIDTFTHQLSCLVEELMPKTVGQDKTNNEPYTSNKSDKKEATKIINELLEKWELLM